MNPAEDLLPPDECGDRWPHPRLTTRGIAILVEVKARILSRPKTFDMNEWFGETDCGSTGCIAGHIIAIAEGKDLETLHCHFSQFHYADNLILTPRAHATMLLFSSDIENWKTTRWDMRTTVSVASNKLFISSQWPPDAFQNLATAEEKSDHLRCAQLAAERIDDFIEQYKPLQIHEAQTS